MTRADTFDRIGWITSIGVFIAMIVDGMDLQMLAVALPSIGGDLGISNVMAGALSTYTFLGMGIGGILAGWLSDRIGRVRVVWWSVLVFTRAPRSSASVEAIGRSRSRTASGFGIAGLCSIGTLLATEYAPTRIRTTVLGVLQAGWSVGYVIAALLAAYLLPRFGWRPLFFCSIVPGVAALALLWGLPDPPSWTSARQHAATGNAFREIWNSRPELRNLLLWTITTIALQFGYYGANSWLPSYLVKDLGVNLQSMGWYVAATYAMMMSARSSLAIVTSIAQDPLGRIVSLDRRIPAARYPLRDAGQRGVHPADIRLSLRGTVRRERDLHERKLSGIGSRNRSGDLVQPWPHRRDAVAATDRHGLYALLHRPGHRPSGHRLRRLCAGTCAVHQGEDVRSESG